MLPMPENNLLEQLAVSMDTNNMLQALTSTIEKGPMPLTDMTLEVTSVLNITTALNITSDHVSVSTFHSGNGMNI